MHIINRVLLAAGLISAVASVRAADFDFTGNFTKDNDIDTFTFTVGAPSTVTVFSSSWASGGFDPMLAIWDASGNRLAEQDDGHVIGTTSSNGVPYSTGDWDSYYTVALAAGDYIATVAEYDNFSNSILLSGGFKYDSSPHFTFTNGYGTQPDFNGVLNHSDARTSDYAFHILNVDSATEHPPGVPDSASTAAMLGLGLLSLAFAKRRKA